jgi:hypothetical protein
MPATVQDTDAFFRSLFSTEEQNCVNKRLSAGDLSPQDLYLPLRGLQVFLSEPGVIPEDATHFKKSVRNILLGTLPA